MQSWKSLMPVSVSAVEEVEGCLAKTVKAQRLMDQADAQAAMAHAYGS